MQEQHEIFRVVAVDNGAKIIFTQRPELEIPVIEDDKIGLYYRKACENLKKNDPVFKIMHSLKVYKMIRDIAPSSGFEMSIFEQEHEDGNFINSEFV